MGDGNGTSNSPVVRYSVPSNSAAFLPSIVAGDFNANAIDEIGVEAGWFCGGSACGQPKSVYSSTTMLAGLHLRNSSQTSSDEPTDKWHAIDLT